MTPAQAKIKRWRENPVQFASEELKFVPDKWQEKTLQAVADPKIQRIGLQACAGPGKSGVLAVIAWWFMTCFGDIGEHPKGAAVSITSDNLKDNLWAELSKWRDRSEWLKGAFEWTKERIFAKHHPETWFISARSWSKTSNAEQQGRTLSGLHSKYVLNLVDESGGVPPAVARAADQALSNCVWGKIIQAGNPVSHDGMLYEAATKLSHLWHMIRITGDPDDKDRSQRIDMDWARDQIKIYGRDNPWVMAYILGEFPPSSINVLLGPDEVEAAMKRTLMPRDYEYAQKRLGIDVAREGDDRSVIFPRQGLRAFDPMELRNQTGPQIASRVALAKENWDWETCFVDDTGGYGASVVDSMQQGNLPIIPINFASKPDDSRYLNRRAEMWFRMAEWVKRGGALPRIPGLVRELTAPTYSFVRGKFALEEKDLIKKRLTISPDLADALALTFAWSDMPRGMNIDKATLPKGELTGLALDPREAGVDSDRRGMKSEWDPFREAAGIA